MQDVDFIIEAVVENLEVKRQIVSDIEANAAADTIIASNTSALPITSIAEGSKRPERILGTHFWNPPYLVNLVEVIQAEKTNLQTVETAIGLLTEVGYKAVHVKKDIPGFMLFMFFSFF